MMKRLATYRAFAINLFLREFIGIYVVHYFESWKSSCKYILELFGDGSSASIPIVSSILQPITVREDYNLLQYFKRSFKDTSSFNPENIIFVKRFQIKYSKALCGLCAAFIFHFNH